MCLCVCLYAQLKQLRGMYECAVRLQATKELGTATANGLVAFRYVGAPLPHWHTPLLLLHSAARSQWPQPLLERQDVVTLLRFSRACLARLQVASDHMRAASRGDRAVVEDVSLGTAPSVSCIFVL